MIVKRSMNLFISISIFLWLLSGWPQLFILPLNIHKAQATQLDAKLGTFAAGSGTQQITEVPFQPKAVLFWITDRTSVGSSASGRFGRGWTDGTNDGAIATAWEDDGSYDVRNRGMNNRCITLVDESGTLLAEAHIVSLNSDGFTLSWDNAGENRLVVYLALGGDAITNVKVGGFIFPPQENNYTDSSIGFQPDAALFMGVEDMGSWGNYTRGGHGFGIAISTSNRHSDAHRWRQGESGDGGGDGSGTSGLDTNYVLVMADDTNDPEVALDLVSWDANGFTLNKAVGPYPLEEKDIAVVYLALKGIYIERGVISQPDSTGNQTVSGLTYKPSAVLFDGGDKATINGFEQDAEMVAGVATNSLDQASFWMGALNYTGDGGFYPSDTDIQTSYVIRSLTAQYGASPSLDAAAQFVSMNSDGFTINWTNSDTTARKIGWIVLGPAEGTLIELSKFEACGLDGRVRVEWETETELDTEGFNLWKREEKDGEYKRINPYFIPAEGEAGFGAEYSYTDNDVRNGKIYYYKLEDIDIHGKSTFHGPVFAISNDVIPIWPDEWEILPAGALLFNWSSSGSFAFKVEISPSPSFPASETISFPEDRWTSSSSLWLQPDEWEVVLRRAQSSGGQLFWRLRAKRRDGREIFSDWKRFVIDF